MEMDCYDLEDSELELDSQDCFGLDELEIECMAGQTGHDHTGCLGCSRCLLILIGGATLTVFPLLLILVM